MARMYEQMIGILWSMALKVKVADYAENPATIFLTTVLEETLKLGPNLKFSRAYYVADAEYAVEHMVVEIENASRAEIVSLATSYAAVVANMINNETRRALPAPVARAALNNITFTYKA